MSIKIVEPEFPTLPEATKWMLRQHDAVVFFLVYDSTKNEWSVTAIEASN